jgi:assimilatory nitrate reductase catalytic subunit
MKTLPPADCAIKTTCPYCGVGCGILATRDEAGTVSVAGDPEHPANFGRLCSKGSALGETIDLDGRMLFPEIGGKCASWDQALDLVAGKFRDAIAEHGPDSVAFYVSGQILTEDYYVANKLMKGFIGSANIDTNSRLCMASSVAGHRRAFGSDTVPGSYEDLESTDLLVLVGSNLAWCHPVLYQRIVAAKEVRPGMKVVVVDPRRTMTADFADLHLAIAPDGDAALFAGLLAYLDKTDTIDHEYVTAHCNGFDEAVAAASALSPADVSAQTGLDGDELDAFYRLFAASEKSVTLYSQGVNQSSCGTDKVNAIINCHLATGRIGKPGMGPFSVTGQPNAMGGREVGGLANMLAGHMEIERADHREMVQRFWQSPVIAGQPGLKAVDLFEAVADGRIKALWIMATNPVDSLPDADRVEAAIQACPFVVVSDVLRETDTVRHAHVALPSTAWGEKDGTVTNSERRISRQRRFLPLPGEAKPDWWQLAAVGKRMGYGLAFDYPDAAAIFREHAALSAFENNGTRDFDIGAYAGIDSREFDSLPPFQWPQAAGAQKEDTRFFANGNFYTEDRKARFVPVAPEVPRRVSGDWPLILNSGRVRDHWHTMTRTGKSPRLSTHIAEPFAELHPEDALEIGVRDADLVRVSNPQGELVLRSLVSPRQRKGSVFVPMHWTDQFASAARVDTLVPGITDPISGQPASKNAGVRAERFGVKLYGFAICVEKPILDKKTDYWAIARSRAGWRVEFAHGTEIEDIAGWAARIAGLDDSGDEDNAQRLAYHDARYGQHRIAWFDGARLLAAVFVSHGPVAVSRSWAAEQLASEHADAQARFRVVAGRPANDRPDPGAIVCSCFSVGVNDIADAVVRQGCTSVDAIGKRLKAGSNCGSCRAEIRGIIDEHRVLAAE